MARSFEWIQEIVSRIVRGNSSHHDRTQNQYPRLYDTRLEDRRVLNAGAVVSAADLLALRFDAGQNANDGQTDTFELKRLDSGLSQNQIAVSINDHRVWQGDASQVASIRFDGSHDVDTFLIDPTISFPSGLFIDAQGARDSSAEHEPLSQDVVVLATASEHRFEQVTYQTADHLVQVRFAEPMGAGSATIQMENVATIVDRTHAVERTFEIGDSHGPWKLRNDNAMITSDGSLELVGDHHRFAFSAPTTQLSIDTRSTSGQSNTLEIQTLSMDRSERLDVNGDTSDAIRLTGGLDVGRSVVFRSGGIDLQGSIQTGPNGSIQIDAMRGTLTVDGTLTSRGDDRATGGDIGLTGDRVRLLEHAVVDVSGNSGGGTIRVGGGLHGEETRIANARQTFLASGAILNADALQSGNGGTIVVWSDEATIIDGAGNFTARGGALGGNGGFIETSGKRILQVHGAANASATYGRSGTWLLDPEDISIVSTSTFGSFVLVSDISTAIVTNNTDFVVKTSNAIAGTGNITVKAAIALAPTSQRTLTLDAINDILFQSGANVSSSNSKLNLSLKAGRNVDSSSVSLSTLSSLTVNAIGDITLGSVSADGAASAISIQSGGAATIQLAGDLTTTGGGISISGGNIVLSGNRKISSDSGGVAVGGNIDLSGASEIRGDSTASSWTIDTTGTTTAGNVNLAPITKQISGLNKVTINTNSATTDGAVTLRDITLVTKSGTAPSLIVTSGISKVFASGTIDLSATGSADKAGSVDFGNAIVAPIAINSTLKIDTSASGLAIVDGGSIALGGVGPNALFYFDQITINTSTDASGKIDDSLSFGTISNPLLAVDGATGAGITILGKIDNVSGKTITFATNPGSVVGLDSRDIDLRLATFTDIGALVFDTSSAQLSGIAGNVRLGGTIGSASSPIATTVDTLGTTSTGSLILGDGTGGATQLNSRGSLDLTKTKTQLASNTTLGSYSTGANLKLGFVASDSATARNLTLVSDADIRLDQALDLAGGNFNATIDNNNNQSATFQSAADITVGSLTITGKTNGSGNDNVTFGGNVTTTGAVQFTNVNTLTIQKKVTSGGTVGANNVVTLSLAGNAEIDAAGSINLRSGVQAILLTGVAGTTNKITTSGANSSISLAKLTANNDPSLTIISRYNLTADAIDINDGLLSVVFNSGSSHTDATAKFDLISASRVQINGNAQVNDQIQLNNSVTVGAGGILIANFDDLVIGNKIQSGGTVTITGINGSFVHLLADIVSNGGDIAITGGTLLVDGLSARQILSGGAANSVTNGGSITIGAIDGQTQPASLLLDSGGSNVAGNVSIGTVGNAPANSGLNKLQIFSSASTTNGQVTLNSIRLIATTTLASSLIVGSNGTTILASGIIDLRSNSNRDGGSVDFGTSIVAPVATHSTLQILTGNSSTGHGGNIQLAGVGPDGASDYFDSLVIDTQAVNSANDGELDFGNIVSPILAIDDPNGTGLSVSAVILDSFTNTLSLLTNPGNAIQDTQSIDLVNATIKTTHKLLLDTSGGANAQVAGNITIPSIGHAGVVPVSLIVDTRGQSAIGTLFLSNPTGATTQIVVNGTLDFSNTATQLTRDASIRLNGGNTMLLGDIGATGVSNNLSLLSEGGIATGAIRLPSGTLNVSIDLNNNQVASLVSTGDISANSILLAGSAANPDDLQLGGKVTSTIGGITFSNIRNVTLSGDLNSKTTLTTTSVFGTLTLNNDVDVLVNNGSIDFKSSISQIQLNSLDGHANSITAKGASSSIALAKINATNTTNGLSLSSQYNVTADDIKIQSGPLNVLFNNQNTKIDAVASFNIIQAGSLSLSGNSKNNDQVLLTQGAKITTGGVLINKFHELTLSNNIQSDGNVTLNGISGSIIHLAADILTVGGDVTIAGGTLFVDGGAIRHIRTSGLPIGGSVSLIGISIDGQTNVAEFEIDARGSSTAGNVSLGTVVANSKGLNRILINTNAPTSGQVTLSSMRLVEKGLTSSSLVVDSNGTTILADGIINLSSPNLSGGTVNLGASKLAPIGSSSNLTIQTSNATSGPLGADGGSVTLGGVSSNGTAYFDSVTLDTSSASKTNGILNLAGTVNPTIAIDGTSGTGITLIGTIVKFFSGVLSFLTNPNGATQVSRSIDVSRATFQSPGGLSLDTSGGSNATTAGDVLVGDIGGATSPTQPSSLKVDTRQVVSQGKLKVNNGSASDTSIQINGDIDLANTTLELDDNAILSANGTTSTMKLGRILTDGSPRNLQLNSVTDIAVDSVNLSNGNLTATIDSNNDQAGATFSSAGDVTAGSVSIVGTQKNDDAIIGSSSTPSTLRSTVGSIQFSNIRTLTLQQAVNAKTTLAITTTLNKLLLGSGATIDTGGLLDLATNVPQIELSGTNGTTNTLTAKGNGSILLAPVSTTNTANSTNVSLTVNSDNQATLNTVDIHSGTLTVTFDNSLTNINSIASLSSVNAGRLSISGNSRIDDQVQLNGPVTVDSGGVAIDQFHDLKINAGITSVGGIAITGMASAKTHLVSDVISNGGTILMTGGTLLVDGNAVRHIRSGGSTVNAPAAGSITLGTIDGESSAAELEIDARGTTTSGAVTLGTVVGPGANSGLNRLLIQSDGPNRGQVSLSDIRLVAKGVGPVVTPSLTVQSGGATIIADGTIDLSSNSLGIAGGTIDFGNSIVAPKIASSTVLLKTSNTNTVSGDDASDGGTIRLGGFGANGSNQFFDAIGIDLRAADPLDASGTLLFGTQLNPILAVDGTTGTGIAIFGNVDNPTGGILRLSTNPNGTTQNTTAIDLSLATFVGSGGIVLDTSGNGHAVQAGDVLLGDVGVSAAARPTSLAIDARGQTKGRLILNDNVVGSTTEIHVLGPIDLSNASVILADDVLIQSHADGLGVSLGDTTVIGGAHDLQLISDGNITVSAVDLLTGNLIANFDTNNNDIGATFRSTGALNVGSMILAGSSLRDDIAIIGGGINTNSSLDLFSALNQVVLSGTAGSTVVIDAKGNASVISLAETVATNGASVSIRSDYSVQLQDIDLAAGTLDVRVGRNTTLNDAVAGLSHVAAEGLNIVGTSSIHDTATLNGILSIGTAGTNIQTLQRLNINAGVQSGGDIAVNNVGAVQVADSVNITSDRGIDLQTGVQGIQLLGANGSTNRIQINGDASTLQLGPTTSAQNVNLNLESANSLNLADIDIRNGTLNIRVDRNANTVGSRVDTSAMRAGSISIAGSSQKDDAARIDGLVETRIGDFSIDSFQTITWTKDVTSSNGITATNIGSILLQAATRAPNGLVSFDASQQIESTGTVQGGAILLKGGTGIGTFANPIRTQTTLLDSVTSVGNTNIENTSGPLTNVLVTGLRSLVSGAVQFSQRGGGNLVFGNVATSAVLPADPASINLSNVDGSIRVDGSLIAGGTGSIALTAQNDLVLASTSRIETRGASASTTIHGNAGGVFQFQPGASIIAGSSNAAQMAVITQLPPLIKVVPIVNASNTNVDPLGVVSLNLTLGTSNPVSLDRNLSLVVNWGNNEIDNFPNGPISPGTTQPIVGAVNAFGVTQVVTHQYLFGNPNTKDPTANIPISVTVGVDALNRVSFTGSSSASSSLTQLVNVNLVVPAGGLFSLRFDLPQTPNFQNRIVFVNSTPIATPSGATVAVKNIEPEVSSSDSSVEPERSYVLRVVTPIDEQGRVESSEDIQLKEDDIADLSKLFERLGDNRYRIFLIREDGNQLMLKDFYLRAHRPIEIDDAPTPATALPMNERVLDNPSAVHSSQGNDEGTPVSVPVADQPDESSTTASAVLSLVGTSHAARSWRKAARRLRTG